MAKKSRADSKRSEISEEQAKKEAEKEIAQYEGLYIEEEEILQEVEKQAAEIEASEAQSAQTGAAPHVETTEPPSVPDDVETREAAPQPMHESTRTKEERDESARKIEAFLQDHLQQTQQIELPQQEEDAAPTQGKKTLETSNVHVYEQKSHRRGQAQSDDERTKDDSERKKGKKKSRKKPNVLGMVALLCVAAGVGYAARVAQQEWNAAAAYNAEPSVSVPEETGEPQDAVQVQASAQENDLTQTEENGAIGILRLVNTQHPLPDGYIPPELEVMDTEDRQLDARAAKAFREMEAAAIADGCRIFLSSGYRSYERQKYLFVEMIQDNLALGCTYEQAYTNTKSLRNVPGTSEHQTGLAADILSVDYLDMDEGFADTKDGKWLKENAARFGFILRYPKGKEAITGTEFEPWHYRYVGVEDATKIMEQGVCLEEYLGMTS